MHPDGRVVMARMDDRNGYRMIVGTFDDGELTEEPAVDGMWPTNIVIDPFGREIIAVADMNEARQPRIFARRPGGHWTAMPVWTKAGEISGLVSRAFLVLDPETGTPGVFAHVHEHGTLEFGRYAAPGDD